MIGAVSNVILTSIELTLISLAVFVVLLVLISLFWKTLEKMYQKHVDKKVERMIENEANQVEKDDVFKNWRCWDNDRGI